MLRVESSMPTPHRPGCVCDDYRLAARPGGGGGASGGPAWGGAIPHSRVLLARPAGAAEEVVIGRAIGALGPGHPPVEVPDTCDVDAERKRLRGAAQRRQRQPSAIADAPDADAFRVHERQRLEVLARAHAVFALQHGQATGVTLLEGLAI